MAMPISIKQEARFVDPNAPLAKQRSVLDSLIQNPPENSRIIVFTPELAEDILEGANKLNEGNRNKRPARIRRFANDMANGKWRLTGDTVKFGRSGLLRDGQNRLRACVYSQTKFKTHVVFGVDDKSFMVMDTGAIRSGVDTFVIEGVSHARYAAPAIRWLMIYEDSSTNPNRSLSPDNAALLEYWRANVDRERLETSIQRAIAAGRPFPIAGLAALLYRFSLKNEIATAKFADQLTIHERWGKGLALTFVKLRKLQMGRIHELQAHALIIQAFNACSKGKRADQKSLKWNDKQDFPQIG